MEANGIIGLPTWVAKPGRSLAWLLVLLFCLSHHAWGAGGAVEVRRLGLSKVAEDTLLTVILDRAATPRVSSREVSGKPQLVVDFPGARAGRLPSHLEGDELLVQQVLTETAAPGGGVRIILDLFPEKPFTYWKMNRPGAGGQTLFILGLKSDPKARPVQARVCRPRSRSLFPRRRLRGNSRRGRRCPILLHPGRMRAATRSPEVAWPPAASPNCAA